VAKVIQLIDNTIHLSHIPSQQPRNAPQQLCTSLQFSVTFPKKSSHFSGALCSRNLITCYPVFESEIHTTDRQYTPASLTIRHSSHAIRHSRYTRFSSILVNCSEQIVKVTPLTFQSSVCSWNSLYFSAGFDDENHTTDRQYTPAVSQLVKAATRSATATLRFTTIFSSFSIESSHFSDVLRSPKLATCGPDFDGEFHAVDGQCTPEASQSATAHLHASLQFSATAANKSSHFSRCVWSPNLGT
jgi:hypothetical protein